MCVAAVLLCVFLPTYTHIHTQVECLAKRLLSLLLLPEARQSLLRLPQPLLCELLSSEALEVDQVWGQVVVVGGG